MEVFNFVDLYPNLFRAIEIAKTGNFTISAYFSDDYIEGFEDYTAIKDYCKGFFDDFVVDGDLKIEICKPQSKIYKKKCDTLDDIKNRIENYNLNKSPNIILDDTPNRLLETAINRCNLSFKQIETIKNISAAIAKTENSIIKVHHVAEAIQYVAFLDYDKLINAENKTISFSENITIKLSYINEIDVKNAIEYLQTLLNK